MIAKWIGATLALIAIATITHYVYADIRTACPAGQVYGDITAVLRSRGANPQPGTMGCTADVSALGLNCPVGDPIQYLLQKRGPNSAGQLIPAYEIQRMGSSFACNLARFIDAGEKSGAAMKIYSGARNFRQPGAGADCQRRRGRP